MKRIHLPHRMLRGVPGVHSSFLAIILVLFIFVLCACNGSGANGNAPAASTPTAPVISAFTASPAVITSGQSSQLAWNVNNAVSLTLNGIVVTGSSTNVNPPATTTYTLVASNSTGSAAATATVTVGALTSAYGNMSAADLGAGANRKLFGWC